MKKLMMIALFALMTPLANAGDQAAAADQAAADAAKKADMAAMEVTEAVGTAADGTKVEAIEITEEAAATGTTDAAK